MVARYQVLMLAVLVLAGMNYSVPLLAQTAPPAIFVGGGQWESIPESTGYPYYSGSYSGIGHWSAHAPGFSLSVTSGVASAQEVAKCSIKWTGSDTGWENSVFARIGYPNHDRIDVYVLGAPGTPFHLTYDLSGGCLAQINDQSLFAWATYWSIVQNINTGCNIGYNTGWNSTPEMSCSEVLSNHIDLTGNTDPSTMTYHGQVYSHAWGIDQLLSTRGGEAHNTMNSSLATTSIVEANSSISVQIVRQGQQPPVAIISGSSQAILNQATQFDGSASYANNGNTIIEYNWTVLDSTGKILKTISGPASTFSYTWKKLGTYQVALKVTDNDGQIGTTTQNVVVVEPITFTSVNDVDPNNPVITFNLATDMDDVTWALDGGTPNDLGALAKGTQTFTLANIQGLSHILHSLSLTGTLGGHQYPTKTTLDTRSMADQTFYTNWHIFVNNLSFEQQPHNNVWVNGRFVRWKIQWGIPGATYDRFIETVIAVLNSYLPANNPSETVSDAATKITIGGQQFTLTETPSTGSGNYWGAAYGDGTGPLSVNLFATAKQTKCEFYVQGFTTNYADIPPTTVNWVFASLTHPTYGLYDFLIN